MSKALEYGRASSALMPERDGDRALVAKAAVRAAQQLGVKQTELAKVIGLSTAQVSKLVAGNAELPTTSKAFELAIVFIRLFRSLDAIVGGDEAAARAWLRSHNSVLGAAPIARIQSAAGLFETLAYVDARRAPV